jgi:hypothetical protein
MKQMNSVIASALVSGLMMLGMLGIGANALTNTVNAQTNTASAQTSTVSAGVSFNSSTTPTGYYSDRRSTRSRSATTENEQIPVTQ